MSVKIHVFSNCSNIYIVWEFDKLVANCIGFAILRKEAGQPDKAATALPSSVGFDDEKNPLQSGPKPSTDRPFQRCTWNDWTAPRDKQVVYKVRAVYQGQGPSLESDWSNPVQLTDSVEQGEETSAFFNDGVIATQWVARELKTHRSGEFAHLIQQPGNAIRTRLGGRILSRLTGLLSDAKAKGQHVYAALFELHDEQLEQALTDLGPNAHVVLSNGSPSRDKKTGVINIDPNSDARALLRNHHVDVHDRIFETATGGITSHLGHNKFAVFCDAHDKPLMVWSGSTNWTWTGLCTQTNNGVLINDPGAAAIFLTQWKLLAAAGANYPPGKKNTALSAPLSIPTKGGKKATLRIGFPPFTGTKSVISETQPADLAYCAKLIKQAKSGILFLMFIPGPNGTLMEVIQSLNSEKGLDKLFVRGVVQQDPGPSAKVPSIALAHRGELLPAPFDIVYPEAVSADMGWWLAELKKLPQTNAIIHSKLVVVDPFGDHPVVITGSHNLGTKASLENDENLLVFEGDRELAIQYAVNVVTIFNQYWWRFQRLPHPQNQVATSGNTFHAHSAPAPQNQWKGLARNDKWQAKYLPGGDLRHELDFWLS